MATTLGFLSNDYFTQNAANTQQSVSILDELANLHPEPKKQKTGNDNQIQESQCVETNQASSVKIAKLPNQAHFQCEGISAEDYPAVRVRACRGLQVIYPGVGQVGPHITGSSGLPVCEVQGGSWAGVHGQGEQLKERRRKR